MSRRTATVAAALAALVLPLAAACVPNDAPEPGASGSAGVAHGDLDGRRVRRVRRRGAVGHAARSR